MGKTLVLGVGNLILSDDGVGIHTIRRLEKIPDLPEEVQIVDGGTSGLDLLHFLEGVDRLIIVDALKLRDKPPGTTARLEGEEVPAYLDLKVSPHEIALPELLFAAKLRDLYPKEVIVWGVQPASMEVGVDLTPAVEEQVDFLVGKVLEEIYKGRQN
jgi:hydrogenase maturation protease